MPFDKRGARLSPAAHPAPHVYNGSDRILDSRPFRAIMVIASVMRNSAGRQPFCPRLTFLGDGGGQFPEKGG